MSKTKQQKREEADKSITNRVLCRMNAPDYAGLDEESVFSLADFQDNFSIKILKQELDLLVFEMIGINVAIANAFRRIMIADVETMAIDRVVIRNNTTIVHDEVLAHRLGLVPIRANPQDFERVESYEGHQPQPENTLHFKLKLKCTRAGTRAHPVISTSPLELYINSEVLTKDLKWVPLGDQRTRFSDSLPASVHDDILLTKMRPGQEVDIDAYAVRGHGSIHAKWSPVATATYQMRPDVILKENFDGAEADKLVGLCPMKVFDIEDCAGATGGRRAVVVNPRRCTVCRECIRDPANENKISLERVKNHFIFSIESSGSIEPTKIVTDAIGILMEKAASLSQHL